MNGLAVAALATFALTGCQPQPKATPPTPTIPVVETPAAQTGWKQIALPDTFGMGMVAGVIADADGFTVYGQVNMRPAAWVSTDGIAWTSVALPGIEGAPSAAATSGTVTVLIGGGSTSRCAHPDGEFLWRRARGTADWTAVPFNDRLFCAGGLFSIAARTDLFMVAGMGTGDQAFAWRSEDGLSWANASAGIPLDTPPWALAATETEFLELGRGERTDVRATRDGGKWTAVEAPPVAPAFNGDLPGMEPAVLLNTQGGLIAIFETADLGTVSAWRRAHDGSWVEVMLPVQAGDAVAGALPGAGDAYLSVRRNGRVSILVSEDLENWSAPPIPDLGYFTGMAMFGDRTVMLGGTGDSDGGIGEPRVFVSTQRWAGAPSPS